MYSMHLRCSCLQAISMMHMFFNLQVPRTSHRVFYGCNGPVSRQCATITERLVVQPLDERCNSPGGL